MKRILKTMLLFLLPAISLGQKYAYYDFPTERECDSLRKVLPSVTNDTQRMVIYHTMGLHYADSKRDSGLYFLNGQMSIARKFGLKLWEIDALDGSGYMLWRVGNYPAALQEFLLGIKMAEDPETYKSTWGIERFTANKDPRTARRIFLAELHLDLAALYNAANYTDKEFAELSVAERVAKENNDYAGMSQIYEELGAYYLNRHQTDTALKYLQTSLVYSGKSGWIIFEGDCLNNIGNAWMIKGNYAAAKINILRSIRESTQHNFTAPLTHSYLSLAELFIKQNKIDSSLYYAQKARALTIVTNDLSDAVTADNTLSMVFKLRNNIDSAYRYQSLALLAKDSLNNAEKAKQFQNIGFTEQLRVQQSEEEKRAVQNKIRAWAMLAGLAVVLLIAIILYRNNRQKQKTNTILEKTLANLKATQTQLIQSEKMASLGELTAGIAHEIQNPLNFVNNFSEVNREMLEELKAESEKPKAERDEQLEIELINNLIENERKIQHHGKRAGGIVKGMLEHSRSQSGQKEPTDINALAEEFMRLSYHGLRAKDKTFNAELITQFDPDLPKIAVIQQDMGRVMLNLFNNAFYAVNQKMKIAGPDYKPEVWVTTSTENERLIVKVEDNGIGIPDAIKEKIMQPFFTTKPTGEGTGLGLSLTYDMVVKGQEGTIQVNSVEGEGSEFIIQLPLN